MKGFIEQNLSNEEWKEFGPNGMYRISNKGRLQTRTVSASRAGSKIGEWRDKSVHFARTDAYGGRYLRTQITLARGQYKTESIHRVVAEQFIGPILKGQQVNHIDGNRLNNSVENLEIVTPKENMQNASDRGVLKARPQKELKLTTEQISHMRRMFEDGFSQLEVAKVFRVNRKLVAKVKHGVGRYERIV